MGTSMDERKQEILKKLELIQCFILDMQKQFPSGAIFDQTRMLDKFCTEIDSFIYNKIE